MSQKSGTAKPSAERIVKDIRRATRKQYSAEEKIRIVLDGLRGEHNQKFGVQFARAQTIFGAVRVGPPSPEFLRSRGGPNRARNGRSQAGR